MDGVRKHSHLRDRQRSHLQATAEQLKKTLADLQSERSQLLLQHHLLSALAEALGHGRATLQDDDEPYTELEQLLLEQLSLTQPPSLKLPLSCSLSTDSSAGSNSSVSDSPWELADVGSTATSSGSWGDRSFSTLLGRTCATGSAVQDWLNSSSSCCHVVPVCPQPSISMFRGVCRQQSIPAELYEPACPENDPFMLFRQMMDQPQDPSARDATLHSLRAAWAADVQQLQVHLQQLLAAHPSISPAQPAESCSHVGGAAAGAGSSNLLGSWAPAGHSLLQRQLAQPDPLQCIKDLQMRMFTMCNSLAAAGKEGLFFQLQLTNLYTGEHIQEPCEERHRATVRELQLSPAQMARMKAGWLFFQRLLAPLVQERRQLHSQGVQLPPQTQSQPQQPQCGGSAQALGGCDAGEGGAVHSHHGARLQAQQEQACRLRIVGKKDGMLRGAMALYTQGCLSWVQQAKLRILMSPYPVNMGIFLRVLTEHMQEQEALQQQRLKAAA